MTEKRRLHEEWLIGSIATGIGLLQSAGHSSPAFKRHDSVNITPCNLGHCSHSERIRHSVATKTACIKVAYSSLFRQFSRKRTIFISVPCRILYLGRSWVGRPPLVVQPRRVPAESGGVGQALLSSPPRQFLLLKERLATFAPYKPRFFLLHAVVLLAS